MFTYFDFFWFILWFLDAMNGNDSEPKYKPFYL